VVFLCGIAGIYDFLERRAGFLLGKMLLMIKHRGPDYSGYIIDGRRIDESDIPSIRGRIGIGYNMLAISGRYPGIIANENQKLWIVCDGWVYNYQELREELEKKGHKFSTNANVEVILHAFEQNSLNRIIGGFSFAIYDAAKSKILVYRDFLGLRPLFYGIGDNIILFASERKALRKFVHEMHRLPPGYRLVIEEDGFSVEKVFDMNDWLGDVKKERSLDNLVKELEKALTDSIISRAYDPIGILFSGGIDSSIIAKISKDQGLDITLFSTGFEDSHDLLWAMKVANILRLPHKVRVLREEELEELMIKTIKAIDEADPLKVLIGMPLYATAEKVREEGFRVAFSGQGADELFGGYAKYLRSPNPEEDMINDFKNLYLNNLERDDHCLMANSVEARYPYLDISVIRVAFKTPMEYKIRDSQRKYVLRVLGKKIGLPREVCEKPKKAVQYGSGVTRVMKRIARKMGYSLKDFIKLKAREIGILDRISRL